MKINTSSKSKLQEFKRLFAAHGQELESSALDLPEIDADPLIVIRHKASQVPPGVLVEDTSLHIEGKSVGIHIRFLLDHLADCLGKEALWEVLLAVNQNGRILVYQGQVRGKIVKPAGEGGFGFDPYFLPEGREKTLAEEKPDSVNARALAVQALFSGKTFAICDLLKEWNGKWQ